MTTYSKFDLLLYLLLYAFLAWAAMIRYNTRAFRPEADGIVEQFLDDRYGDDYIEHRWPNMIVANP